MSVLAPTREEIEAAQSQAGGWTKEQLAVWGVSWPPPKGWRRDLERRAQAQRAVAPHVGITDHALLRWLERRHGVDVDAFRRLMRSEMDASLLAFDGIPACGEAAFVICGSTCVTMIAEGQFISGHPDNGAVAVPVRIENNPIA